MDDPTERILDAVAQGSLGPDEAARQLHRLMDEARGFADQGFARPDLARAQRQGVGEVVFGEGKDAAQIAAIAAALLDGGQPGVLATRVDAAKAAEVERLWREGRTASPSAPSPAAGPAAPGAAAAPAFAYHEAARLLVLGEGPAAPTGHGPIVVACAGTSDLPVAEEAALTAEFLGNEVVRCYDVGVAGLHRLMACADDLRRARVVVAVAGMEGALASVVGGLVGCPVIAVPTSVGYGASFGGMAALLAMLNSCASGVSVVNIDNGFGAAYQASLINHLPGA